ncbi:MAG: L-threonylcarbamoyladenylate synthase [Pseudomonadota bacterium]
MDPTDIERAVAVLREGGLVCYPTETFYALAADTASEAAVARLLTVKGRDDGKPIAAIAENMESAQLLWARVPEVALVLAAKHWPGPLTMVLGARSGVPAPLCGHRGGVGVRVSSHPWARALASALGRPVTSTSANLAGSPPPSTVEAARAQLGDSVGMYLDGGKTPGGHPSTVIAVDDDGSLTLLRQGAVRVDWPPAVGEADPLPAEGGETLDSLLRGRLRLWQPRHGPRVSLDPLFLGDFVLHGQNGRSLGRVLDLGCGTGIIGLGLALADAKAMITALELQPTLASLARRNAELNHLADRVEVVCGDLRQARSLPFGCGSFDVVVANPPFKPEGCGRRPARHERALASLEIGCTLEDIVAASRRFLGSRGRLALVFPAERVGDLLSACSAACFRPLRMQFVHSVAGEPARRVLFEAARHHRGGAEIMAPLVVHEADRRTFTPEAARILE